MVFVSRDNGRWNLIGPPKAEIPPTLSEAAAGAAERVAKIKTTFVLTVVSR